MRLFCFSDTHQRALPDCKPIPDAWLFAGDLYDKQDRGGLTPEDVEFRNVAREWRKINPQPVYAVKGNHDLRDKAGFFSSAIDLTGGAIRHIADDLYLAGLGWVGEQFFELPLETHLVEHCQNIEDEWERLGARGRLILMTHYPPHDRKAIPYKGSREGFFFDCVRNLIDEVQPMVVIAGHSHVHFGLVSAIGLSLLIFPGRTGMTLKYGGGRLDVE